MIVLFVMISRSQNESPPTPKCILVLLDWGNRHPFLQSFLPSPTGRIPMLFKWWLPPLACSASIEASCGRISLYLSTAIRPLPSWSQALRHSFWNPTRKDNIPKDVSRYSGRYKRIDRSSAHLRLIIGTPAKAPYRPLFSSDGRTGCLGKQLSGGCRCRLLGYCGSIDYAKQSLPHAARALP